LLELCKYEALTTTEQPRSQSIEALKIHDKFAIDVIVNYIQLEKAFQYVDMVFKYVCVSGYMTLQQDIDRQLDRLDKLLCSENQPKVRRAIEYKNYTQGFDAFFYELVSYKWTKSDKSMDAFTLEHKYLTGCICFFGWYINPDIANFQFIDYHDDGTNKMEIQTIPFEKLHEYMTTYKLYNPDECVYQLHPELNPAPTPVIPDTPLPYNGPTPMSIAQNLLSSGWEIQTGSIPTTVIMYKRVNSCDSNLVISFHDQQIRFQLNKIANFDNPHDLQSFYDRYLAI
jgi:hypothetical protein